MNNSTMRYLYNIKELESTIYTQNRLLSRLKKQSDSLGNARKLDPPTLMATESFYDAMDTDNLAVHLFIGTVIAVVYMLAWFFIPPLRAIVDSFKEEGSIMGAVLAIGGAILLIPIYMVIASKKGIKKGQARAEEYNQRELKTFSDKQTADKLRVQKELHIKEHIDKQIHLVEQQKQEIEQTLKKLYALNVIHPKYRNLVAIASFCEYFETGRCAELTGHEGAYNIYEQETRMNLVLTKLDLVISKLEEIKENQYVLYQALSEANSTLSRIDSTNSRMIRSLNAIQENTALTEYNSRVAAISARATGEFLIMKEILR